MKNALRAPKKAQINFASFDFGAILNRMRNGTASASDLRILASFCGTYLRDWQDIRALIARGIVID